MLFFFLFFQIEIYERPSSGGNVKQLVLSLATFLYQFTPVLSIWLVNSDNSFFFSPLFWDGSVGPQIEKYMANLTVSRLVLCPKQLGLSHTRHQTHTKSLRATLFFHRYTPETTTQLLWWRLLPSFSFLLHGHTPLETLILCMPNSNEAFPFGR